MAVTENAGGGRPPRTRPPPRAVEVAEVVRLTPRVTRVAFTGAALAGFGPPRPGAHMKVFFPEPGSTWTPGDETVPRPPLRTYTPRRFDPDRLLLDVEFVHHGDGIAATWAARAKVGEAMFVAGPGGGYDLPADATEVVLVADDTAMPAAGTILEALPASVQATVLCEIENAAEERQFSTRGAEVPITWLHRAARDTQPSTALEAAVRMLAPVMPGACWWIACEAGAMRRIRQHLLRECGVDAARLHTRGYWKLGETAYPDHDYGVSGD